MSETRTDLCERLATLAAQWEKSAVTARHLAGGDMQSSFLVQATIWQEAADQLRKVVAERDAA